MAKVQPQEYDSAYFLKALIFFIIGGGWIAVNDRRLIPVGLVIGLIFVQFDRFQIDRKIEYALLIVASVLGLFGLSLFTFWIRA